MLILFKVSGSRRPRGFFYRVISIISVVLRETTLTISVSTGEPVSMESEIVKMISLLYIKGLQDFMIHLVIKNWK